jgi:hypothetical protein
MRLSSGKGNETTMVEIDSTLVVMMRLGLLSLL